MPSGLIENFADATARKRTPPRPSRRDDHGFVLISVVGILLMLSIISLTLMLGSRNELRARQALGAQAELLAQADGMVRLTALQIAGRRNTTIANQTQIVDGRAVACRDGDIVIETRVSDVNGLVDINSAPPDLLEILLRGLALPPPEARALAAAIVDFRSPFGVPLPGGAKGPEYAAAGRTYGPKNAPYDSIDELDQVLGMTPELLERLRPLVTMHARSPALDTAVAPLALLEALTRGRLGSGATLAGREQFQSPAQLVARSPQTRGSFNGRSRASAYHIQVVVADVGQRQAVRSAVVELSTRADFGFIVREWTSRGEALATVPRGTGLPLCEGAR